jgi:hypothetical protein
MASVPRKQNETTPPAAESHPRHGLRYRGKLGELTVSGWGLAVVALCVLLAVVFRLDTTLI